MNWDDVQVFLAIARGGTLQAASIGLNLDRTTVARRLAALEKRLGAPLFSRTRTGLSLTSSGQRALDHATRMDAEARSLETEAAATQQISGRVRIAVTEGLAPTVAELGLLSLVEQHPQLRIELLAGNKKVDLVNGEADLALRMDPLQGAALRARCLDRSAVTLFASADYLARRGRPKTPKQLAGHHVLLPGAELAGLPEARWLAAQGGVPILVSNSIPALVAAARTGAGVVPVTSSWGRRVGLEPLFEVPCVPPRAMWLVSTKDAAKRPACGAVIAHITALVSRFKQG